MNAQATTAKRAPREAKAPPATAFINARIIDPASNRDEPGGLGQQVGAHVGGPLAPLARRHHGGAGRAHHIDGPGVTERPHVFYLFTAIGSEPGQPDGQGRIT